MSGRQVLQREARAEGAWDWPVDVSGYDRDPSLRQTERDALADLVLRDHLGGGRRFSALLHDLEPARRLVRPLEDALGAIGGRRDHKEAALRVMLRMCVLEDRAYWGWDAATWRGWLRNWGRARADTWQKRVPLPPADCRPPMLGAGYLLGCIPDLLDIPHVEWAGVARLVFGQDVVNANIARVRAALQELGYGPPGIRWIAGVLGAVLLLNRSPALEDLNEGVINDLRQQSGWSGPRRHGVFALGRALAHLGILRHAPVVCPNREAFYRDIRRHSAPAAWLGWVDRWEATSTIAPKTRASTRHWLVRTGRWLQEQHPEALEPAGWTREVAVQFVAAVDRMRAGDYVYYTQAVNGPERPFSARTKRAALHSVMRFFVDLQEWGWIPTRFNPARCLATPRSVSALIGPAPRVIADDVWAKLLWAGLNLAEEDLPRHTVADEPYYPLELVRAVAVVWLFGGLRSDEIMRLRVGCIRWQTPPGAAPGTAESRRLCLLDVPVHKTGTAFTKPVDPTIGEAVAAWEAARRPQPRFPDPKTGEPADFLFCCRSRRLGRTYINRRLIPILCRKAGVPGADARGPISSHRARSTIASQLGSAREPMSLMELQAWLGHRSPETTQHYVAVTPTRLAKAYTDAAYFARNTRAISVLIDQEAIKEAAAARGEPWRYYDLGHGLCTYEFFDQCPHRMACARCNFYVPKASARAQLLEARTGLLRMLQEIPLTDDERAAVDGDSEALQRLLTRLAGTPTPSGGPIQTESG